MGLRQLMFSPLGLVTQPNKIGVFPPGAMSAAVNVIMRAPATISQAYSKTSAWATLGNSGDLVHLLHSTPNQVLAFEKGPNGGDAWAISWIDPTLTSPTVSAGAHPYGSTSGEVFSTTGRLQATELRGRIIVNGKLRDNIVADYVAPTSLAQRTFRRQGLRQTNLRYDVLITSGHPAAIENNTAVTYSAITKRVFADGYLIQSRPATFQMVSNDVGSTADAAFTCSFVFEGLSVGDIVELYRSQAVPYTSGDYVDPGSTLYRVAARILTAADIAAGFYAFTDTAMASSVGDPLNGLGEELYTNPFLGGIAATVNDPPPVANCVAAFRNRVWYSNLTFNPQADIALHAQYGTLVTDDERNNGIGARNITATRTNGSPTLTAISASHMLGLAVGQWVSGTGLGSNPAIITAVGATTVTLNSNCTSTAAGAFFNAEDIIELNGAFAFARSLVHSFIDYRKTATKSISEDPGVCTSGVQFSLVAERMLPGTSDEIRLRATRGDKYDPQLPLLADATPYTITGPLYRKNGIMYSLDAQPEAVPVNNELEVGKGEIYASVATRDALWFFCSDGLFRLSGTIAPIEGIPDIRVDPIDTTLIIAGPRAYCVLRDRIYAYTSRGFVEISDDGVREISTGVIGDLLTGAFYTEAETPYLVADLRTDEIYIMGAHASLNFLYSLRYDCFTTTAQFDASKTGVQVVSTHAMVFGYANRTLDELQPDLTALVSTGTADFQPVFGDRPDTQKHWQDVIYIFDSASNAFVSARINGLAYDGMTMNSINNSRDKRCWMVVPRNGPAIGPSLAVGFAIEQTGRYGLSAVSIGYAPLTGQGGFR